MLIRSLPVSEYSGLILRRLRVHTHGRADKPASSWSWPQPIRYFWCLKARGSMLSPRLAGCRALAILLLVSAVTAPPVLAQRGVSRAAEPDVPEKSGKELVAHYVGDTPPRI